MAETEWLDMLAHLEELHRFSRLLLTQSHSRAQAASELELLSLLYLHPQENTPLALSRRSGMKKEAVSRCLRLLHEKGFITREKHPCDERSSVISITTAGHDALEACYGPILRPIYALRRNMGKEFYELFRLIASANRKTDPGKDGTR